MDGDDGIDQINEILGGKFLPTEESEKKLNGEKSSGANRSDSSPRGAKSRSTESGKWIPELKRVVQFSDGDGKKHVIGVENYKTTSRPSRRREETDQQPFKDYAILLKAVLDKDDKTGTNIDYRLELQSDELKSIFRRIAAPYRELRLDADPIIIEYPFRCLFFLRGQLREIREAKETDLDTRRALAELLGFIHSSFGHKQIIEAYNELVPKHGKITFPLLWAIFPPYEPVILVRSHDKIEEATGYLLESVRFYEGKEDNPPHWELSMLYAYHDGNNFHVKQTWTTIKWFNGAKDIHPRHLHVIPLRFFPEEERNKIRRSLVERGKLYVQYCESKFTFMHYTGYVTLRTSDNEMRLSEWGSSNSMKIDERIVIDRTAERVVSRTNESHGDTVAASLTEYLSLSNTKQDIGLGNMSFRPNRSLRDLVSSDQAVIASASTEDETNWLLNPKTYLESKPPALTDDDYFICQRETIAFALDQKLWVYDVRVDPAYLKPIEWKEDPFQSLQLSPAKKRLVHRLVRGFKSGSADVYDDIIKGKGKGLIFLLHGPPGLGKTLTAESVAESVRRPLYHVSTGELSIEVGELESQLSDIFRIGARWNAVVLLDEADVLMSKRTVEDLRRNSIVAVFLRLLEYYRGMLFLTTNRHDDFDDAFYNRIHVTIQYGQLEDSWKTNIWRQHIERASRRNKQLDLWTEDMFQVLGEIESNGRDIKNYARTAYAFAQAEDEDLSLGHLLIVLENNIPEARLKEQEDIFKRLHTLDDGIHKGIEKLQIDGDNGMQGEKPD